MLVKILSFKSLNDNVKKTSNLLWHNIKILFKVVAVPANEALVFLQNMKHYYRHINNYIANSVRSAWLYYTLTSLP